MSHPTSLAHFDKTQISLPTIISRAGTDATGGNSARRTAECFLVLHIPLSIENMSERMGWKTCANAQLQGLPQ